ncbi:MAG: sugar phosphate isomerase/epimerase [Clostridia bacterium]|nr:sugar phosphate isomerase/epimerase [Clostridia bacterium]
MKIGISTASLFPDKHSEEAAKIIKSLGVDLIEIFLSTFYEYRPEFSKALAPEIEGVEVNSLHTMPLNFEPNIFNSTRRVRGDGYYWLDQVARSAQLLKCHNYTFHGFVRPSGGRQNDDMGYIGDRIAEAHAFTAGYGVNLCLENTSAYAYNRPGFFKEVKSRCGDLYGVFDIKQARRSGYPYGMYLKDMEGAIAYVHLSDVDENGRICLPGKGVYDFEKILKELKDSGFDGNIMLEVYRGNYSDFAELKQSVDFVNEIIYKIK